MALGLIALCLAVLACASSAPSGQTSEQAEPNDTPKVTATAQAGAHTPAAEPTATATGIATPKPTISSKVEPMLHALAAQSPSAYALGTAGQTTQMVSVRIWPAGASASVSNANWTNLRQLVTDNGGAMLSGQEFSVPVSLLTAVVGASQSRPGYHHLAGGFPLSQYEPRH